MIILLGFFIIYYQTFSDEWVDADPMQLNEDQSVLRGHIMKDVCAHTFGELFSEAGASTSCLDLAPLSMSQGELIRMIPPTIQYLYSWFEKKGKVMNINEEVWSDWPEEGVGQWLIIILRNEQDRQGEKVLWCINYVAFSSKHQTDNSLRTAWKSVNLE